LGASALRGFCKVLEKKKKEKREKQLISAYLNLFKKQDFLMLFFF